MITWICLNKGNLIMKKNITCLIIALAFASSAQGSVVVNAVETGGNVVFTGSGTIDQSGWTLVPNSGDDFALINPGSILLVGETPAVVSARFLNPTGFVGPSNFGSGGQEFADSGSGGNADGSPNGDIFGLFFNSVLLVVPGGYTKNDPLSGTSTYNSTTLALLGMNTGSYTWTWDTGTGANPTTDSLTLNVGAVPVPAAVWLFGTALIGLVGFSKRKKAA
jgi:hypothetical protein